MVREKSGPDIASPDPRATVTMRAAASASNATMDNASGGLGCDVGGMPARDGGGVGGLLLLGLAFLRKKKAAR